MNSNTHDGGRNLMPVVVGGEGINATRSPSPTNCRATIPPIPIGMAEPRAAPALLLRAAHPFLGDALNPVSQGVRLAHAFGDVAESGDISTARHVAVPRWGKRPAKGKRGPARNLPHD